MKYSIHSTEAEARAEITRIEESLGIPSLNTFRYADPEEFEGQWRFRVKENGTWKCDNLALNVQDLPEDNTWLNEGLLG